MSAPTEVAALVPNYDRRPGERYDIRPHGTEARAMRERRRGDKPCPACLRAEQAAHAYRSARRAAGPRQMTDQERTVPTMTDRISTPQPKPATAGLEPEAGL